MVSVFSPLSYLTSFLRSLNLFDRSMRLMSHLNMLTNWKSHISMKFMHEVTQLCT